MDFNWDLDENNWGQSRLINSSSLLSAIEVISSGEDWAEGQVQDRHWCHHLLKVLVKIKRGSSLANTWRLYCSPSKRGSQFLQSAGKHHADISSGLAELTSCSFMSLHLTPFYFPNHSSFSYQWWCHSIQILMVEENWLYQKSMWLAHSWVQRILLLDNIIIFFTSLFQELLLLNSLFLSHLVSGREWSGLPPLVRYAHAWGFGRPDLWQGSWDWMIFKSLPVQTILCISHVNCCACYQTHNRFKWLLFC